MSSGFESWRGYDERNNEIHYKNTKGEERTLIGYRTGSDYNLGRSHVIDLEADKGTNENYDARHRLVDHRNINWLIYKLVRYSIK